MKTEPLTPFVRNRAEELGYDVWEHFVVPPFYDRLGLFNASKPTVIQGGRGCGKTMLLRYLSHRSMFSPSRPMVPEEVFARIGLYWKADTQFARTLTGRGVEPETWRAAFEHAMALRLTKELLKSLGSIARSASDRLRPEDLSGLLLEAPADFDPDFPDNLDQLVSELERRWRRFRTWVNNPRQLPEPLFLPCTELLGAVIEEVGQKLPSLERPVYMVYVDEYENLCIYQQRFINTCLKSSELPLIFNIAAKRNSIRDRRTLGDESITEIHDYRPFDIEQELSGDFPLFAAEILFHNVAVGGGHATPVNPDTLRSPELLETRRQPEYRDCVLAEAKRMFPGMTHEQLAGEALSDRAVRAKLEGEIQKALRGREASLDVARFIRTDFPQASIVVSALLNRESVTPEEILAELDKLKAGEENRFTGTTDWVHNNFIGCLLRLYDLSWKVCPFYGGFEAFLRLAHDNLRHFLELCHKSLANASWAGQEDSLAVSCHKQAQAALQASSEFLREVRTFGPLGNALHTFVLTIGSLFALSQERPTQSEPEVRHFSIVGGTQTLGEKESEFFTEAIKWSVLFEERETKRKTDLQQSGVEWVLNPIYSPYFRITYRKGRRLSIASDAAIVLIGGTYDERRNLLRTYQRKWLLSAEDVSPTLFSHLEGD